MRRETVLLATAFFLSTVLGAGSCCAGVVNVRDHGAKGDGMTDDTEAIRKAAAAASATYSQPSPIGCYVQAGPVLLFPSGTYVVSDEISVGSLEVRGEGRAMITQKNPAKNILVNRSVWRMLISGLTFIGGGNQVDLQNVNLDTGQIIIDHCRFYAASGFGVRTDVLSTTVKISDCEFLCCHQTWYNGRSDQAVMRDCWITTNKDTSDKAAIEHRGGRLTIENIVGVPLTGSPKQRWIDNYGANLTLEHFRFGGEGGGFTPVYNFTKYTESTYGSTIFVNDCFVGANASFNANCVIYAHELPNAVVIRDSQLCGSTGIILDRKINLADYFTNTSRTNLTFRMEGCTGEFQGELPKGLTNPVITRTGAQKPILSKRATAETLKKAKKAVSAAPDLPFTNGVSNNHKQQSTPGTYLDLTEWAASDYMDATFQRNSDWLAPEKVGSDVVIVFRQDQPGGWPHLTVSAKVDLDKYPWLTWKQKKGTAPGAFAVKVVDVESGAMVTLYGEMQYAEHEYYAKNLKDVLKMGGVRELKIRFYPLAQGWEYPSAKAGQYVIYDFARVEKE